MNMLEKDTECWVCGRSERGIIAEIKSRRWAEGILNDIRKENTWKENVRTKEGIISLMDVGTLGYSYPICAICAGLIDSISDKATIERLDYEASVEIRKCETESEANDYLKEPCKKALE